MKKLRNFICAILIIATCVFCTLASASAETDYYYKVMASNTVLYSEANTSFPICEIKQNCYVKKEGRAENNMQSVSYMGVSGWVKTADVSADTFHDLTFTGTAYWHERLTIRSKTANRLTYEAGGNRSCKNVGTEEDLCVLGLLGVNDSTFVCVFLGNDAYGYIPITDTNWDYSNGITAPTLVVVEPSPSPSFLPSPTPSDNGNAYVPVDPETDLVKFLLIVCICIPAVIIVYLIFKPAKPSGKRVNYDDDFDE